MAIPESFIQELTARCDIVDVISGYVRLTKHSGANRFGLCPFHSEKTPSFSVSPEKQIYHCFGCGKGGGVISFIMDIENVSFVDAVQLLAGRCGMTVPEDAADSERPLRQRMLELNKAAARYFYQMLAGPQGGPGMDYVRQRAITPVWMKNFGLGYAPDSWDSLISAMRAQGFSDEELVSAGLAKHSRKGGGIYDTFRGRLMFPVIDARGSVIGFSGRILGDGEPKYLNSPETLVFNKSRNLFALNLAKKSKSGYILLCEGNVDVLSLHQAGFDSAVASLGTSLTQEQARLISRYTQQVIIAYDNDGAGAKASQRAIEILERLDLKVRVLQMQGAKDPDEFLKARGADAFRALIDGAEGQVEYRLDTIRAGLDLETDQGRVAYLQQAAALIASLPSAVEREVYAARAAEAVRVSPQAVKNEAERLRKTRLRQAQKKQEQDTVRAVTAPRRRSAPTQKAEEGVIRLLYWDISLADGLTLSPEEFTDPLLGRMYTWLRENDTRGSALINAAAEAFTPDEVSRVTALIREPEDMANARKALEDYVGHIRARRLAAENDLNAIARQLRETGKGYGG